MFKRLHLPALMVMSIAAAGCATTPPDTPMLQRLDESDGATVTTLPVPMSFYRERPMLAANARDYVYIGPVEVNQGGHRRYMLWVGYRSTIDRTRAERVRAPGSAWLMLDGMPMELIRARQTAERDDWLYDAPIAGGETVTYTVTRAQLLAIAKASALSIVAEGDGKVVTEFAPWREPQSDFRRFSRYLERDPTSRVALVYE